MQRDFYQILGVSRTASSLEIRAAFVRLVKRHHPDAANTLGAMPQRLQDIQQAYRCLSDIEARGRHDHSLNIGQRRHLDRQRAVQNRLRRYDRRHPHAVPRPYRRVGWRSLLMATLGVVIIADLSLRFFA